VSKICRQRHAKTAVTPGEIYSGAQHLWLFEHRNGASCALHEFNSVEQLANYARVRTKVSAAAGRPPTTAALAGMNRAEGWGDQRATVREDTEQRLDVGQSLGFAKRDATVQSASDEAVASQKSTETSTAGDADEQHTSWLDVQTRDPETVTSVLRLFPVHSLTAEQVMEPESLDHVEIFTSLNYIFVNLDCRLLVEEDAYGVERSSDEPVVVSVILFRRWVVTIHNKPFAGMVGLVKKIESQFGLKRRTGSADDGGPVDADAPLMSTAWVLNILVDFVVESFLPDPTVALENARVVDELIVTMGSKSGDRQDILLRISTLRARISAQRAHLFRKEQLLRQLLTPSMRSSFVAKRLSIVEQYDHTLSHISHVAQRLDAARDALTYANANFISFVGMNLAKSSMEMSRVMQPLSLLMTIILPINIMAGLWGTNFYVPFQVDYYPTYNAFAVMMGVVGVWVLLWTWPLVKPFLARRTKRADKEENAKKP
jgi:Mg2+ and Co2+ transporter CorA